jgi:holo-[acyl-carrier protein] synthase
MIYGIGTDILRRERIVAVFERHGERFAGKILGPEEMAIYRRRSARLPERGLTFLATRFAAKEAFSKAIGLGMRMPMTWRAMQLLKEPSGKPRVATSGALAVWMAERHLQAHVSVTDESDYVAAFAVVEQHLP